MHVKASCMFFSRLPLIFPMLSKSDWHDHTASASSLNFGACQELDKKFGELGDGVPAPV